MTVPLSKPWASVSYGLESFEASLLPTRSGPCCVLTSPCPECFGSVALSSRSAAFFPFPTTATQRHNRNRHLHSASPCPVVRGFFFFACVLSSVHLPPPWALITQGDAPGLRNMCRGEGSACHDRLLLRASFSRPTPLTHAPPLIILYVLC